MPWVEWERVWLRSHVTAGQVRARYRARGRKVRVSLTGHRSTFYRSRRTGRIVHYAAYARWGPARIHQERWREWLVEVLEEKKEKEEWEVTVRYQSGRQVVDVTARLLVPAKYAPAREEDVRAAFWRAVHGGELTQFRFMGVDWRREVTRHGKTTVYEGGSNKRADLESFRGMARRVGYYNLRVARVEA